MKTNVTPQRHPCDANDCNDTTTPTKRCGRCRQAWYCSVACQRRHRVHHAPFCLPTCRIEMTIDPEMDIPQDTMTGMKQCIARHHTTYVKRARIFMTVIDNHPVAYGNLEETLETLKRWIPNDLLTRIQPQLRQCATDHSGDFETDVAIVWFTRQPLIFVCDRMRLKQVSQ